MSVISIQNILDFVIVRWEITFQSEHDNNGCHEDFVYIAVKFKSPHFFLKELYDLQIKGTIGINLLSESGCFACNISCWTMRS